MKKTYHLKAGRKFRYLKQCLSNEDDILSNKLKEDLLEVYLSEDLGLKKGDKVEVTIDNGKKR